MSDVPQRPIISAAALEERIDDPWLRIADVRWILGDAQRGRRDHASGHIRGAVFVDLDHDLSGAAGAGRHPLPDPMAFAERLGQLGFGDEHAIVAYDDAGGTVAARLWWMLDRLGHHDVAVLDGGLAAWTARGAELSGETPRHLRSALTLEPEWPGTIDRDEVNDRQGRIDLIDLRAAERYRGDIEPVDPVAGHIPGARNRPAAELLGDDGRLLEPTRLQELLLAPGRADELPIVMSCGSGVTACFGALAARVSGLPDPLIYPGSYSDWSNAGMPIAAGDDEGDIVQR